MHEQDLLDAVREASLQNEVTLAIGRIYGQITDRLRSIAPRCERSGRCCQFEEFGHRLYVTTAELAAFVAQAKLRKELTEYSARPDGGACRYQLGKLCQAHEIRPMGCRIFFCDPTKDQQLNELYEQMHRQLKDLHDRLRIPYYYIEWRTGLNVIEPLLPPEISR